MKNKRLHIVLTLVLSLAVTDHVWLDLIHKEKVFLKYELEDKAEKEELRESEEKENKYSKLYLSGGSDGYQFNAFLITQYINRSKLRKIILVQRNTKLFILFRQIKIPYPIHI